MSADEANSILKVEITPRSRRKEIERDVSQKIAESKFNIPGTVRLTLSANDLEELHFEAIEDSDEVVTAGWWRRPRKMVSRKQLVDVLEKHGSLEFRREIIECENDELLLGHVDKDQFYLALTTEARNEILAMFRRDELEEKGRVERALTKKPRAWKSLGSDVEVDDNIPRSNRSLLGTQVEVKYPPFSDVKLGLCLAGDCKHRVADLTTSEKYAKAIVQKRRADLEIQATPSSCEAGVQTVYKFPKSTWTQYEYEYKTQEVTDVLAENLTKIAGDELSNAILVNGNLNFYTSDYGDFRFIEKVHKEPEQYAVLKDLKRGHQKVVTSCTWRPSNIIAVAYGRKSPLLYNTDNKNFEIDYNPSEVVFWDLSDVFQPKLLLDCPSEVQCLGFHPSNRDLLAGGCDSGQVVLWNVKVEVSERLSFKREMYRQLMFTVMGWAGSRGDPHCCKGAASDLRHSHNGKVTSLYWTGEELLASSGLDGSVILWKLVESALVQHERVDFNVPIKSLALCSGSVIAGTYLGGLVSVEEGNFKKTGQYHDGPVAIVQKHPFEELYLSVGGKVFVVWSGEFRPLLWRKSKTRYAHGSWLGGKVYLSKVDGKRELWDVSVMSDKFVEEAEYSGRAVLECSVRGEVMALTDEDGLLRLFRVHGADESSTRFREILRNNDLVKLGAKDWQEKWTKKYASHILQAIEEERLAEAAFQKRREREMKKERERMAKLKEKEAKRAAELAKPPAGFLAEWSHRRWIDNELDVLTKLTLRKKNLDPNALVKERVPLQRRQVDERKLRTVKRMVLTKADAIFDENVRYHFPEVVREKVPEVHTFAEASDFEAAQKMYVEGYYGMKDEARLFVHDNPHVYKFDWTELVERCRREKLGAYFEDKVARRSARQKE